MNRRSASIGGLVTAVPGVAIAHGQELVLYWFTSEVALLVASLFCLFLWRERTRTKVFLFAVVVATAAATNMVPFMPGSLSFMAELGPIWLFGLFALVPVAVAGLVYAVIRFASNRARDTNGAQQAAASNAPKAARR
jgi:hypothetical protein